MRAPNSSGRSHSHAVRPRGARPQLKRDPLGGAVTMDDTGFGGGYIVGWGTLALINAGLAQTKNRSGLAWFLISMILGPIATFVILFLAKAPEPPRDGGAA